MGDPDLFVTNIEASQANYALGLTQPVPSLNALWATTR
jgi:hypothetical protein